ncbi:beta-glucosidase BglX [Flavisolibacter ginsenosidimutans]|uniref:Periplasmic beta-glucosidase n=1 Tax=Flavisolibacter ginsenosidimutans TaxID=661481 RepID=A0A5B8UN72_9BACT|nr:beta-glucosidase BglX [Flavisolibacter ginsenosidimutans]QEC58127.1 beta-glucosidase BglX [Flavisolibacter ginsenosidimutans]
MKKLFTIGAMVLSLFAVAQNNEAKMNAFVSSLMSKMTLDEKIGQLNLVTPGGGVATGAVVSTDVEGKIKAGKVGGLFGVIGVDKIRQAQELAVTGSHLKIPLIFGSDVIHGYKTTFPIPLGLSCSWDIPMIERSARVAATEASADGLCWVFSPMVDIARDPRWGRVAEGAGEDPYLGSQISAAMIRGYQGTNLAADNTVMACVKHFALYGAAEGGRDYNTVDMSRIKMYEYYLPPYKAAVDAGVGSVMSSFNEIDGIPATGNKWLLTDLLRRQWGFKGFVVSDYTSVSEMIDHGMGDLQTVSALALNAGLDMDMVAEGFLNTTKKSLPEKKVTQAQIDAACRRILEAKYKLGLFDDPYRYCNPQRAAKEVLSADKRAAAREFGVHSTVLLKNSNQTLPLKKSGTIALIGPLANNKSNMLGTWAVSGDAQLSVPVLDGMKAVGGSGVNIVYAKGANVTDDPELAKRANVFGERVDVGPGTPEQLLSEAVATATKADVIVAVVGEASEFTGEASSRTDLSLPQSQRRLLDELAKTGKPLVVVLMSGRPLTIEHESSLATSLLQVWFEGHEAGNAIADVLFGAYNPSGKLSMSWPRNVGQIPVYYNHKNTGRPQDDTKPGQKFRSNYLDVANTPLYAFGYGLSYTSFSYSPVQLSKNTMRASEKITATVTVTNSGNYDGEEVVQLYIRDMVGSVTRPVKELKGFQKIRLRKGESRQVSFTIDDEMLKFWNSDLKHVSEPGAFKVFIGGSSDNVQEANFTLMK